MELLRYPSFNGESTCVARLWTPVGRPRGVVQIAHGMAEHMGRYRAFTAWLAERGFAVCGGDHAGHGKTAPLPRDLGYFGQGNGAEIMVEDLHTLRGLVSARYPGIPYFLLGHSMGSLVARRYVEERGEGLSGVIIMGTSGPNAKARGGIFYARRVVARHGRRYRSQSLDRMAFGSFYDRLPKWERTPFAWLSRNQSSVDAYLKDPRCGFLFTASALGDLIALSDRVNRRAAFAAMPVELPVLLISGAQDPVGDYCKGVVAVRRQLARSGTRDLSMKLYPGARHELLQEWNRRQVYAHILQWMETRL